MRNIWTSSYCKLNDELVICQSINSQNDTVELEIFLEEDQKLPLSRPVNFQWSLEDIDAQDFELKVNRSNKDYDLAHLTLKNISKVETRNIFDSVLTIWDNKKIIKQKLSPKFGN